MLQPLRRLVRIRSNALRDPRQQVRSDRAESIAVLVAIALGLLGVPAIAQDISVASPSAAQDVSPIVVRIIVQGNERYARSELIAALGQREGQALDKRQVSAGIDTLWTSFHAVSHVSYVPVEGGVELLLDVDEVPSDFEPRFVGNSAISTSKLHEWAGLEEGGELFLNRVPGIRRRLLDAYRAEGYYFVEIAEQVRMGGGELPEAAADVFFEIREGPRVKVGKVLYNGNESLPNERFLFWKTGLAPLAEVESGRRRFPFFLRPAFVEETLYADLVAMRNVYRDQGWLDAVVELDHLEFNEARDRVTIHVAVDEGQRYSVGTISIEGVRRVRDSGSAAAVIEEPSELLFAEQDLLKLCSLRVGNTYEKRFVDRDRFILTEHYGERGNIYHSSLPILQRFEFLEPRLVFDVEKHQVHITYRLAQGQQHFIREVRFSGGEKTQDRVLRRELSIFPGEVADLKEIHSSLRRVRNITAFENTLTPYATPATFKFVETSDPAWKDLEFSVPESGILRFNISAVAGSGLGVSGGIDLELHNFSAADLPSSWAPWTIVREIARGEAFHGGGQRLNLHLYPGTEISTYLIEFREPDIFMRHIDRYSLSVTASRRLAGYESHDEERREVGFRLGRQITPDSSVFAGIGVGSVDVDELDQSGEPSLFSPLSVPKLLADQEGETDLTHLDFGYSFSDLDFPIAPNAGRVFRFTNSVYSEFLGGDTEFARSEVLFDWYVPIGEDEGEPRSRFRTRFDLGVAWPFGSSDDVLYTERFFLGGRDLRGFDRRGVGPNENGFPKGGETQVATRFEYIFPLFSRVEPGSYRREERFTGALFLDTGILDPDSFALDLNELRASVGFSVSLWLGLPLTLSFGFPIRDGEGDDRETFRFDIGLR